MDKKGIFIGIDYSDDCCQACYFNERHAKAESVFGLRGSLRYLIPTWLCLNRETGQWLIGDEAGEYSDKTGALLYTQLLYHTLMDDSFEEDGRIYVSEDLLAIYIRKILELVSLSSGSSMIAQVNIAVRNADLETKQAMERVFIRIGIDPSKLHLISYDESFAFYILHGDRRLWANGSLLFDFSRDGFYAKRLSPVYGGGQEIIYMEEEDLSARFSIRDLNSDVLRLRLDERLNELYESLKSDGANSSVYFTGDGFDEIWFTETIKNISATRRAFRGNNIYAQGACLKGLTECTQENRPVIAGSRSTKAAVSVEYLYKGRPRETVIVPAAKDWYEASGSIDLILDETKTVDLMVTSLIGRQQTLISFELSSFPDRPPRTTRVRVDAKYISEHECEICITDLGFGDFYKASGKEVRKILELGGYI